MLQFVVGALSTGCVVFLAVAFLLGRQIGPVVGDRAFPIPTLVALIAATFVLVQRAIIPSLIVQRVRRALVQGDSAVENRNAMRLAGALVSKTIVGAAMLEAAVFFLLVAHLLDQSPWSLGAAAVLIVGLILHLPTTSGMTHWIEDELRRVNQERQFRPR